MSEEPSGERVIAGRYRLLAPLGEGGMGTVWRARDEVLHREVAVKEVRAPAGLAESEVRRLYARLEREAWAAARVADRNVVTVYDVATQDGRPWIVMELVRGLSLAELLDAEGPIDPRRAAHIGAEVLSALRAAHAAGVLHRDVKPANVLLSNDGRVVLTDFGIAQVEGSSALTMTGEVIGSPEFLAPERALGRSPGTGADLWSLGVLLYAAVEGHSPFRQDTPLSTLRAVVDGELPPPHRAGALTPVIEGLLRKDPAERLTAEAAQRELRGIGAGGAPRGGTAGAAPPDARTVPVPTRSDRTPPMPVPPIPVPPVPPPAGEAGPAGPAGGRTGGRRTVFAVVAGLVVPVLALAGLAYALLGGTGGNGRDGSTASAGASSAAGTSSAAAGAGGAGSGTPAAGTSPGGGTGSTTQAPPPSVRVTVVGVRTDYTGACPPPPAEAPSFTAVFTVGRLPAQVSYRWVARDGQVTDQGWRTLSFPAGGPRTRRDRVVVTTHADGGTYRNALGVEIRDPVHTASEAVPFSVTCVEETPTGGVSSSASASAYSSPPASPSASPASSSVAP
ncbi:serine/threonine-protein kinase [Streptomyces sp. MS06]|uniref:serine/threonine-protein kinase n=1 Tax=Streptomyces sp. MS06 TaxID=3385974 RepID=UPI0039A0928B